MAFASTINSQFHCRLTKLGSNRNYSNYCSTAIIGGETENLLWTQKPPTRFVIETSQLITLAVCCGYVSNLIGRRTINIPEIILGVHGFMGFTVIQDKISTSRLIQESLSTDYPSIQKISKTLYIIS